MNRHHLLSAVLAGGALSIASSAGAALVETGIYRLHNHPDGNALPPAYGAKLTELYNVTSGTDVFSFDFDAPGATMWANYNGTSLHIFGVAYGGRDIGTTYANDMYKGFYTFDFTYQWGLGLVPGDDDLYVNLPTMTYNYGTMVTPFGDVVRLRDGHYDNGQPDFRFGNETNDAGHRGFNGISGWGWMFYARPGGDYQYVADSDWLFTAERVPTPGAAGVLLAGAVLAGRRRRR